MTAVATLPDVLSRWSVERPLHLAFRFLNESEEETARLTYRELEQSARQIARRLAEQARPRERVLLFFDTSPELVTSLFGCFYADVVAVQVDLPHGRRAWGGIGKIAADCQPALILTTQALWRRWGESLEGLAKDVSARIVLVDEAGDAPDRDFQRVLDPSQPAFLQYTSGSTGVPKGVMVTHRNVMVNVRTFRDFMRVSAESVLVSWLPLFHDLGLIGFVLQPVHAGCSVTLMSPSLFMRQPVSWLRAITRYGGTFSAGPDYAYRLCCERVSDAQRRELDLGTWHVALDAAERVSPLTLQRFAERFEPCGFPVGALLPGYGMAEATLMITARVREELNRTLSVPPQEQFPYASPGADGSAGSTEHAVSCGRAPSTAQMRIVDPETHRALEDGQIGEVWSRGEHVTSGYWNRPEESARTFAARLADTGDGPFLRTGDLGFVESGELFLIGRLKEIIIIHGRNYAPQDIEEAVVVSHPALRTGHVIAGSLILDDQEVLTVAAEIDRAYWRSFDGEEVVSAIREAVSATFGIGVAHVALLRPVSLPKTTSGKLRRLECRRMLAAGEWQPLYEWWQRAAETSPLPAETPVQPSLEGRDPEERLDEILAWLCRQLALALDCPADEIAIEEPFTRYGLDSAGAARLAEKLEVWLSATVSPTAFWEHPHPLALAEHLAALTEANAEAVEARMV